MILMGPGVCQKADPPRFEAQVTGFVELHNDKVSVRALSLVVGDIVGGEYSYSGGLIVLGDVKGSRIHARGPIAVKGSVVDSEVRGASHVVLMRAEKSRVVADGDIHANGEMSDCEFVTPAHIVGLNVGRLVGGSFTAAEGIEVCDIGDDSWPATSVHLGAESYAAIRLSEIEAEIKAAEANAGRIAIALRPLMSVTAGAINADKRKLVQTLMDQKRELEQHVRNLHAERRSRQMTHYESAGIVAVTGRAHPGVKLNLYGARMDVEQCQIDVEFQRSADGKSVIALRRMASAA